MQITPACAAQQQLNSPPYRRRTRGGTEATRQPGTSPFELRHMRPETSVTVEMIRCRGRLGTLVYQRRPMSGRCPACLHKRRARPVWRRPRPTGSRQKPPPCRQDQSPSPRELAMEPTMAPGPTERTSTEPPRNVTGHPRRRASRPGPTRGLCRSIARHRAARSRPRWATARTASW